MDKMAVRQVFLWVLCFSCHEHSTNARIINTILS